MLGVGEWRAGFNLVIPSANIEYAWLVNVISSETPKVIRIISPQPFVDLRPWQRRQNQY